METYKIKVKAIIVIHADGKRWEQEVPLEYETTAETPWDAYTKAYFQQKEADTFFGNMEICNDKGEVLERH